MSGVELCKQLRAARIQTPIIVLSAIGDEVDKVLLLEIGADDYMVKPFGTRELLARIRAVLRRTSLRRAEGHPFGDVEVDLDRRAITPPQAGREADARRIQSARLLPPECRSRAYPRCHSQLSLGL